MKIVIKRGDIFYVDLSPVAGSEYGGIRPAIVIQNDVSNKYSPVVTVAAITSQINEAKLPTQVEISSEVSGLEKDSVILLEQIRTLDKRRFKRKIGSADNEILEEIDTALSIFLDIKKVVTSEILQLKEYIHQMTKPLVITEGKTDARLIQTAWKKLYPGMEMFFECTPAGIQADEEKRTGGAETVRRSIEFWANIAERQVIGLFDNDREGNEKFGGLNKDIFEKYDIRKNLRKHKYNNVWGMLLPVPHERKIFVTDDDITQRYFVIEHYFSDDILKEHLMYGSNILGTCVFKVKNRKDEFSKEVDDLAPKEFKGFEILFSELKNVFSIK